MIHSLRHRKGARAALFLWQREWDHTPVHFQMHRVRKPDEPDKSNGVENLNKNKVCAEG